MKKFFKNLARFSLTAVFFYLVVLMIYGTFIPNEFKKNLYYRVGGAGFTYTRLREAKQFGKVDLLFLGSSHAYRGFDTRIFKENGYASFNLGTVSQTPLQTELLLNRFLDKFNPSTIIYEVYPYTFSSDGVESSIDLIANSEIDYNTISMALKTNNIKTYNTLAYGSIHKLIEKETPVNNQLYFYLIRGGIKDYIHYIPGGFTERRRELVSNDSLGETNDFNAGIQNKKNMLNDINIIQTKEGKWGSRDYQIKAFERVLKKLKEKNIRVILVQAPINSEYYAMIKCNKEIDAYFSSKGEYYNFNELIKFDNELDFADYDHLNEDGVKKMNEALIQKAFKKN